MIDLAEPFHAGLLTGRRILVVEDEPLVAMDLVMELDEVGAKVICVARTLNEALAAAKASEVDLAILDGNLDGDPVDAVASTLAERGVPFCFVSGYGPEHLPADFRQMPLVQKPFNGALLRQVLGRLLQH